MKAITKPATGTLADLKAAARVYLPRDLYDRTDWRESQFQGAVGDYVLPHSTDIGYGDVRLNVLWEFRTDSGHWAPFTIFPLSVCKGGELLPPITVLPWVGLPDAVALAESIRGVDEEAVSYELCETPGLPETVVVKCDRYVDPDAVAI